MQAKYQNMSNTERAKFWTECIYGLYDKSQLPSLKSDKILFEQVQDILGITATDWDSQLVYDNVSKSLENRQKEILDIYRAEVQKRSKKDERHRYSVEGYSNVHKRWKNHIDKGRSKVSG